MKKISFISLLFLGMVLIAISCQKNLSSDNDLSTELSGSDILEWFKSKGKKFQPINTVNDRSLNAPCEPDLTGISGCLLGTGLDETVILSPTCSLKVIMDVTFCSGNLTAYFAEYSVALTGDSDCEIDEQTMQDGYNGFIDKFMVNTISTYPGMPDCGIGNVVSSDYTQMTCTKICQKEFNTFGQVSCAHGQGCCSSVKTWCLEGEKPNQILTEQSEEKFEIGKCTGEFSPINCSNNRKFQCTVTNCK